MRHNVLILAALVLLGVLLHRSVQASGKDIPDDPLNAHKYADAVLAPRFAAAYSEWSYHHPVSLEKPWEHVHKLDRGDVERWRQAREAFKRLDAAMKRAGY